MSIKTMVNGITISIPPNTIVGVGFDTSNFSKGYVWTQLITSESNVNVTIISGIDTGPPNFGNMIFVEASLSLTQFAPKVTLVNTSGNRLSVNFTNTSSETVEVRVALKGIG